MNYAITIAWPEGFDHAGCVLEVAETLQHGLRELGHETTIGTDLDAPGQHIVLLPNLLPQMKREPPPGAILYNLEQIVPGSLIVDDALLDLYRRFRVWDYSTSNADALEAMGIPRPTVVPLGWAPHLARIPPATEDIDVLFYGTLTPRRAKVLMALGMRGYEVHSVYAYGEERDAWLARAKVILNVHYHDLGVFEVVRSSYLLGNGRVVVSERGVDRAMEDEFAEAVAFAEYEHLVDRCGEVLGDPADRKRRAKAGKRIMASRKQAEYLRAAV